MCSTKINDDDMAKQAVRVTRYTFSTNTGLICFECVILKSIVCSGISVVTIIFVYTACHVSGHSMCHWVDSTGDRMC